MARKTDSKARQSSCILTTSKQARDAANKQVAAIKDRFPPGLSQPALRALAAAGYANVDQLADVRESELAQLHGMGPKAIAAIRADLEAKGKSFRE